MADFYVNYGSSGAKLVCNYKCGKFSLKLHQLHSSFYVLSKNRKIIYKTENQSKALAAFHNAIYLEAPDLFNF